MTVGILDQAGLFTKYFRTNLPAGFDAGLQLIVVSGPESLDGLSLDLLAVAPDLRSGRWEEDFHLSCRLLLLPGTAASLARRLHAASVVSYGSSPRDTLTISSESSAALLGTNGITIGLNNGSDYYINQTTSGTTTSYGLVKKV